MKLKHIIFTVLIIIIMLILGNSEVRAGMISKFEGDEHFVNIWIGKETRFKTGQYDYGGVKYADPDSFANYYNMFCITMGR